MIDAPSARRMAENEVVFRTYNETMQQGLSDLAQVAKEDRQEHLMLEAHEELHFYCECSDENCRERIIMPPQTYADFHKKRNHFIVVNGHEVDEIEHIVYSGDDFAVVEKYIQPPEIVDQLKVTNVDNVS